GCQPDKDCRRCSKFRCHLKPPGTTSVAMEAFERALHPPVRPRAFFLARSTAMMQERSSVSKRSLSSAEGTGAGRATPRSGCRPGASPIAWKASRRLRVADRGDWNVEVTPDPARPSECPDLGAAAARYVERSIGRPALCQAAQWPLRYMIRFQPPRR